MKRKIKMGDNAQVEADVQKEVVDRPAHIMSSKENKVAKSISKIKDIEKPEVKEKEEEAETEFLSDILSQFQTTETAPPTDIKTQNAYAEEIKVDNFDDDSDDMIDPDDDDENLANEFEDNADEFDETDESEEFNLDDDVNLNDNEDDINLNEDGFNEEDSNGGININEGDFNGNNTHNEACTNTQPIDAVQAAFSKIFNGDMPKFKDDGTPQPTSTNSSQSQPTPAKLSRKGRMQQEDDEIKAILQKSRHAQQNKQSKHDEQSLEALDDMNDQLDKAIRTVAQPTQSNFNTSNEDNISPNAYEDNFNKLLGNITRVVEDSVQEAAQQIEQQSSREPSKSIEAFQSSQEPLKPSEAFYTNPPTENYTQGQILGFNDELQQRSLELDEQERQQLAELEQIEAQRREQDRKLQEITKRQQEIAQQREAIKAKEREQQRKLAEQKEQQRQLSEAQSHLDDLKDEVQEHQQILQNNSNKAEYIKNIRKAKDIKDAAREAQAQLKQSIQNNKDELDVDITPDELESLLSTDVGLIESLTATINKTQNRIEGLQNTSPESYQAAAKSFNIHEQLASIKASNKTISYIAIKRKLKDSLLKTLVETGLYYTEIENKEYPASVVPVGTELIQMGDKYYCAYTQVPTIYSGYRTPLIEFMNNLTEILRNLVVTGKAEISLVNEDNMSILTHHEFSEIEGFLTQNDVTHRIEGTSLILTC